MVECSFTYYVVVGLSPAAVTKTIRNNEELQEIFNKYFSKLGENLHTDKALASNITSSDITDLVFNAIKKSEYHPSIKNYAFHRQ